MRIAVIIPTYNRPDALALVLDGYLAQTDKNFEIIIADDGSTQETKELIQKFKQKSAINITHIWQPDEGFRLARVRNIAAISTKADYLILTDGDCVPLQNFVAEHRRLTEAGWFLSGNRVLLSERLTNLATSNRLTIYSWSFCDWVRQYLNNSINRILPFVSIPLPNLIRKISATKWKGAKTCNLSLWRKDYLAVNGMDESYVGWGMDDSDLVIRLFNLGIKRKNIRFATTVLHLWHKENDRSHLDENIARLNSLIQSHRTQATQGINQHLEIT